MVWCVNPSNCVPTWPISANDDLFVAAAAVRARVHVRALRCPSRTGAPDENGMSDFSTRPSSKTSPVRISRVARSTVSGFM